MKIKRTYLANFEAHSLMLIAACTLGGVSTLHAQTTPATPAPSAAGEDAAAAFARADTNKDGKLSKAEAQAIPAVSQRFEQIDTDADGTISRAEYDKATKS